MTFWFLTNCHDSFFIFFVTMCSNFLGMKSILAKKNNYNIFFLFWDIFIYFFISFVIFFQSCYPIFHFQNVATHCKEQNQKRIMTIGQKNKKVIVKIK